MLREVAIAVALLLARIVMKGRVDSAGAVCAWRWAKRHKTIMAGYSVQGRKVWTMFSLYWLTDVSGGNTVGFFYYSQLVRNK